MAFVSSSGLSPLLRRPSPAHVCRRMPRMTYTPPPTPPDDDESAPPAAKKMPVTNSPAVPGRKLVRNVSDAQTSATYADGRAGDMVGGPAVGEGMGPRRGAKEKKVTRAAAIQKSQTFADAWAEQNQGKVDVWLIIGLLTLLTPFVILGWAVATGIIPTGGLFEG